MGLNNENIKKKGLAILKSIISSYLIILILFVGQGYVSLVEDTMWYIQDDILSDDALLLLGLLFGVTFCLVMLITFTVHNLTIIFKPDWIDKVREL